ncbi:MAG: endonuclease III [Clostridia bacterium]|nr:endonuclease III [Clostridia bacterium]
MKKLNSKENINKIVEILDEYYPEAKCGLEYESPLSLTVSLILAAQCTDKRVNVIAPILLKKYPTVEALASADVEDIERIVKPCGFYKNKAKNISLMAKKLEKDFYSKIPDTMDSLTSLNGIGRKSANIILQECFGKVEGIAVDTHVSRTTYRMGLTNSKVPLLQEKELIKIIDKKYHSRINHILVWHGRNMCDARKPKCDKCPVNSLCLKKDYKA